MAMNVKRGHLQSADRMPCIGEYVGSGDSHGSRFGVEP